LKTRVLNCARLSRVYEALGERGHVNVTSYNRQVLLTGEVPNEQDKQLVEQILSRVDNVRAVVNELEVLGNSTLTQRSSDALVTGRVKAGMVDAKDLFANAFKVTTERGTTYLMGAGNPARGQSRHRQCPRHLWRAKSGSRAGDHQPKSCSWLKC
jgi:osmotically-inducible protein OsmY